MFIIISITMANIVTAVSIPIFEIRSIVFNTIVVVFLTMISYRKINILSLSAVYALFTIIIILLSTNLADGLLMLAHRWAEGRIPAGRIGLENDILVGIIYLVLTLMIGYIISQKYGGYFHKEIRTFDDSLKKKLAQHLLYGAIITLAVFIIIIFLRYVIVDRYLIILVYVLGLAISFTYLLFATFAFVNNTRLEIELHHKEELMQNLQAYTVRVDSFSQELQNFKHDNMNLMLGFGASIKTENWDGLRKYYSEYMEAFSLSISENDAIIRKLKRIYIPPLASLLLAKRVQAQQQKIDMWLEVDGTIPMPDNDFVLLDLCRIVGILLDNALEACEGIEGTEVRVLATNDEAVSMFIFENTCHSPPSINEIFNNGFSTKGDSRGRGLYNVAQIIAKNQHIDINTSASGGVFTQKLKILY